MSSVVAVPRPTVRWRSHVAVFDRLISLGLNSAWMEPFCALCCS
jgi:hypothetical protein